MADKTGWVKLFRKITDHPMWDHDGLFKLFAYCVMEANYRESTYLIPGELKTVTVARGSFVTGRDSLHAHLYRTKKKDNPCSRTVWRWLSALESMDCVKVQNVSNRFSVVTVCNYESYQQDERSQCPTDVQPVSNPCPTDVQLVSTSEEGKEGKERKKVIKEKKNAGEENSGVPENADAASDGWVPVKSFCINPQVTSIAIGKEVVEYHEDAMRWEAEFIRRWNLLSGVNKRTVNSLDAAMRASLQERLRDQDWDWKQAFMAFPLPMNMTYKPTLGWFLKPDTVSKILDGRFQAVQKVEVPTVKDPNASINAIRERLSRETQADDVRSVFECDSSFNKYTESTNAGNAS